jgi:hypothetical protein
VILEDEADAPVAERRQRRRVERVRVGVAERDGAAGRPIEAAADVEQRALAA